MVNLLKNRFSLYSFTTALLLLTHYVDAKVQGAAVINARVEARSGVNGKTQNNLGQFSCDINSAFFRCKDGQTHGFYNKTYQKTDKNTNETVAIQASGRNTVLVGENITVKDASSAVHSKENFWKYGIVASENGKVTIERGEVNFTNGIGVEVRSWGSVGLKSVSITEKSGQGMSIDDHSENLAFHASGAGIIHFEKGKVNLANAHGFSMHGNNIDGNARLITIVDSTISVESNRSYGLRFWEGLGDRSEEMKDHENPYPFYIFTGEKEIFGSPPKMNLPVRGIVDLTRTSFTVPNSAAIYSRKSGGVVRLLDNSKLSGDLLLKVEDGSFVKVSVDASTLVGGTRIDESSAAEFRLKGSSKWILSQPKNKNLQIPSSIGVSSISLIHLIDSSIVFEQPETNIVDGYQTLRVGRGTGEVYNAQGNAHLYLNAYLNKGGALQNQKTDRLLVHGDVKGKTMVHVRAISGSPGGGTERYGNDKGISIIQVSGRAEKDSFLLDGDYIALDGLPYQYRLHAYGPNSELGRANASQRLVDGEGDFWDFRLENGSIDSNTTFRLTQSSKLGFGGERHSRQGVKVVVPQVPTYLLLPNSLFQAGLMDISNQNKQLETQRANLRAALEIRENPASFLRGYGGNYRYVSDLSALEYGYGGDLGYYAVEAGVLLQKIENIENVISFGVMGSYGKLSLQPKDVTQSQKSTFDKWTATVYGSMQHDTGFYIDGLLSYGLFKGDVVTTARGKTATLKGNPLSLSLMGGQKITTGYEGLVFDPQAQVVYQHLQFHETRDIDNFNIEMDKLDQWLVRIGGRLTKTLAASEKDRDVSFYGKVHFSHDFGKERSVRFKDSFQLGAFGSSLEAGLGLKAQLSSNFALHGDVTYQHHLSKGGFLGTIFSGGLRYRF